MQTVQQCSGGGTSTHKLSAADCAHRVRALYGREGRVLLRAIQHLRPYTCPFEVLVQFVPDNSRVLDVGCGGGLFLGLLVSVKTGISGIGFDVSEPAIATARGMVANMKANQMPCPLEFLAVTEAGPLPEGQFDLVSVLDVVHHVSPQSQGQVLEYAAARVRPGGILLYKDMCTSPLWRRAANRCHDLLLSGQWVHEMDPVEAESRITTCGLELIHSQRIDRFCYGHDIRVFRRPEA